jgi:transcriptional regulator with XRE-family HTH domain
MTSNEEAVNPFRALRQEHNLTLDALGRLARVSKQALIRLEQGTFVEPLPAVLDYWTKYHGYSELILLDEYEGFRKDVRKSNWRMFGPALEQLYSDARDVEKHPFTFLRGELSITELAKRLCIPQSTLQHFEAKWITQQSVPKELISALYDIGYVPNQVDRFCRGYILWRHRMLGKETEQGGVVA